jgi:hypothetical protein
LDSGEADRASDPDSENYSPEAEGQKAGITETPEAGMRAGCVCNNQPIGDRIYQFQIKGLHSEAGTVMDSLFCGPPNLISQRLRHSSIAANCSALGLAVPESHMLRIPPDVPMRDAIL